jgi:hypothetical protein
MLTRFNPRVGNPKSLDQARDAMPHRKIELITP